MGFLLGFVAAFLIAGTYADSEIKNHGSDISEFEFNIEMDADAIKLTCADGCAWKTLSFNTVEKSAYLIDYYGLHLNKFENNVADSSDSDYLIAIQREDNDVSMKGFKGTAWVNLEFGCIDTKCNRIINQFGVQ